MTSRFARVFVFAELAIIGVAVLPVHADAQQPSFPTAVYEARSRGPFEPDRGRSARVSFRGDTTAHPSRRAAVTGAIVGALIGGLGTAAYVLNATAYDCVTSGPPCRRRNYVLLHTVTISAGTVAGALLGVRVGRWVSRKL